MIDALALLQLERDVCPQGLCFWQLVLLSDKALSQSVFHWTFDQGLVRELVMWNRSKKTKTLEVIYLF